MKALKTLMVIAVAMALPFAASAADDWKFSLHGFVSMSGAYQDGNFGASEGQQAIYTGAARVGTNPATGKAVDPNSLTFDVRQSRFNFSVAGPQVLGGAQPKGVLEIDWFGGFGSGNYGDVSLVPRIRLAYSELAWGKQVLRLGQDLDLIFAQAPTSLSHIAFPLGYMTGNLGWRRPGIFGFHTFDAWENTTVQFAWEIGRSQWADAGLNTAPANGIGQNFTNAPNSIGLGEASSMPAVEGRLTLAQKDLYTVWVAAHGQQTDLNGVGPNAPRGSTAKQTLTTSAYLGGLKLTFAGVTLAGTGFTGKNVSPLVGQFLDFKYGTANTTDVASTGYWGQLGYNVTKEFSLWAFYGEQSPKEADAKLAAETRLGNKTTNVMAMYRDGGYGFSGEWVHFEDKVSNAAFTASTKVNSNQYMLSANYFF
jgi:hypothetical protein